MLWTCGGSPARMVGWCREVRQWAGTSAVTLPGTSRPFAPGCPHRSTALLAVPDLIEEAIVATLTDHGQAKTPLDRQEAPRRASGEPAMSGPLCHSSALAQAMPVFGDAACYQRSSAVVDRGARGGQRRPADPVVVTAQQQVIDLAEIRGVAVRRVAVRKPALH